MHTYITKTQIHSYTQRRHKYIDKDTNTFKEDINSTTYTHTEDKYIQTQTDVHFKLLLSKLTAKNVVKKCQKFIFEFLYDQLSFIYTNLLGLVFTLWLLQSHHYSHWILWPFSGVCCIW